MIYNVNVTFMHYTFYIHCILKLHKHLKIHFSFILSLEVSANEANWL